MRTLLLTAIAALSAAGCSTRCDTTAFVDKLTQCGIEVPDGATEQATGACTEERQALIACEDDCTTSAACDAFDGTNLEAAYAWASCMTACQTATTDPG